MLENGYPFGAIINKNMMNDDYQRTNWPVLFNYGVAENEMKWRSCCNRDQNVQVSVVFGQINIHASAFRAC